MKHSIAYKYLGIVISILVTVQLCLGFWQSRWHYSRQLKGLEQRLQNKADFLSAVSIESIFNLDFLALENLMKQTSEDTDIVYSIIVDHKGQALTRFLNKHHPIILNELNNKKLDNYLLDLIDLINQKSSVHQIKKKFFIKIDYWEKFG